jgi:hypothetical protein
LQHRGRWQDALAESRVGRELLPDDFNLDLLHARSLLHLERAREAIEILNATHVLPSENARESHLLYEQAHLLAALDAIDGGMYDEARQHLRAALEWPAHLGQGRPYDPEERLVHYLLGHVERHIGEPGTASAAFQAVVDATDRIGANADLMDLLVIPALSALGRSGELRGIWTDTETTVGLFGSGLVGSMTSGVEVGEATALLSDEHTELFDDLAGKILLRSLMASGQSFP